MDSQSENHICKTCTKNLSNYFNEKADIERHEEQCQKFSHQIVKNNSNYTCSICNSDVKFYQYQKILQHMVESHDTPSSSTENIYKPAEENSNDYSENTLSPKTEEPMPNPSSSEVLKETTSSNAKTIKWEQELKNSGYILCDCRTGFLDLESKNLLSLELFGTYTCKSC